MIRELRCMGGVPNRPAVALLLVFNAAVAAAQTPANWTEQAPQTSPSPRGTPGLAYDSAHDQVVLFGGATAAGVNQETWTWDGSQWTQQFPQTRPVPRSNHAMAYDSAHGQVVLFGGSGGGVYLNDTWLWDGTNWTKQSPQTAPSARYGQTMAYDSAHQQVVLFGGVNLANQALNDTWVWDGTNWTQKSTPTSPPAAALPAMTYDSAHGQVVLFGGYNGSFFNETWAWDGTNWTKLSPQTSPPGRNGHAMAYDSVLGQVILFGGVSGTNTSSLLNDTWVWDGMNWSQKFPASSPEQRYRHAMVFDSKQNQTVMFGGRTPSNGYYGDTWTWLGGPPPVPVPVITAVVNAASFVGGGVVPGEMATIFGTNLTSSAGINLTSSLPLPTMFLTDTLMINNQAVALFAVDNVNGQQQINFQVPWEVASGPNARIVIENNGTSSAPITVPVLTAQPGIFNYIVGANTFGAILHASFQLADTAHPAQPGESVLIYCTGLGSVSSPPDDGTAGNGENTLMTPTVTIGGTAAMVSFSGLAPGFVGLYQINVDVPTQLQPGNQPVVVEVSGASSSSVLLPVQ